MFSKKLIILAGIACALALIMGCSGGDSSNPILVNPDTPTSQSSSSSGTNHVLWGMWQCYLEPGNGQIDIVPLRTANFTANVNKLLEGQPGNLLIEDMDVTDFFTEGRLDCTITLKHPFPGLNEYNGFDVWGVFMHNANGSLTYDSLTYGADPDTGENVAVLLNPDGWARWFNYTEFNGGSVPILEYHPGVLSNLPNPTATLNPFKIFADGLDAEDDYYTWITTPGNADNREWFMAGSVNSRRYELEFPIIDSNPVVDFQYAVIATWDEGDPALTGDPSNYDPFDFPTSANCEEAFFVNVSTIGSELYYIDPGSNGGTFHADIELFDWQGGSVGELGIPNEVGSIFIEGDFVPGGTHEFTQVELATVAVGGTENSSVFQVEIANCTPHAAGDTNFWVIAESAGLNGESYDQGFPTVFPTGACRAAFTQGNVSVEGEMPIGIVVTAPNGGESWEICSHYDITWVTNGYTGQVKLEYSKDGFVSDINEIVAATDDDGVYDWLIPCDPSDTVRVRASFVDDPFDSDESNAVFTIPTVSYSVQLDGSYNIDSSLDDYAPSIITKPNGDVFLSYCRHFSGTTHTSDYAYTSNSGTSWTNPFLNTWGGGRPSESTMAIDAVGDAYHRIIRSSSIIVRFSSAWPNSGIYLSNCTHGHALIFTYDGYPVEFGDSGSTIRYKKGLDANSPYSNGWTGWNTTPQYTAVPSPARLSQARCITKDPSDAIYFVYYSSSSSDTWIRMAYNSDGEGLSWDYANDVYDGASDGYDCARDPSLWLESDGDWHSAFILHTDSPSSTESIAYVRSEDGLAWNSPSTVYEVSGENILDWVTVSAVVVDCCEILVITFQENDTVYLTYSWDKGQTWQVPTQLSTGDDRLPDTTVTDDGYVHTCWEHDEGTDDRVEYIRAHFEKD